MERRRWDRGESERRGQAGVRGKEWLHGGKKGWRNGQEDKKGARIGDGWRREGGKGVRAGKRAQAGVGGEKSGSKRERRNGGIDRGIKKGQEWGVSGEKKGCRRRGRWERGESSNDVK